MYIGPQGIVHGTTITILNAGRMIAKKGKSIEGMIFVSSDLAECLVLSQKQLILLAL